MEQKVHLIIVSIKGDLEPRVWPNWPSLPGHSCSTAPVGFPSRGAAESNAQHNIGCIPHGLEFLLSKTLQSVDGTIKYCAGIVGFGDPHTTLGHDCEVRARDPESTPRDFESSVQPAGPRHRRVQRSHRPHYSTGSWNPRIM